MSAKNYKKEEILNIIAESLVLQNESDQILSRLDDEDLIENNPMDIPQRLSEEDMKKIQKRLDKIQAEVDKASTTFVKVVSSPV